MRTRPDARCFSFQRVLATVLFSTLMLAGGAMGCATRTMRVHVDGFFQEALARQEIQSVVDVALGESKTVSLRDAKTTLSIESSEVSAGVATLDLVVTRKEESGDRVLANPRVKVQLGESATIEMRDSGAMAGPQHLKLAVLPRLLLE
ncbi:MAG: hypothetical protein IOD12_09155 [Silvanigrellales bacterium]|jgi:hypothetical protein|nr:hypothetical protein [Silvanigrellales bacterium]